MIAQIPDAVLAAFIAFCRIGGCFMVMPGLSSARLPMRVRLLLVVAVVIAMMVLLWDHIAPHVTHEPAGLARLIATETVTGGFIGLVARMYMLAIGFIGTAIAMSIGLGGIAGATLEETEPQAALGALISMFAVVLLFTLDLHHQIIRALVASYTFLPVNAPIYPAALLDRFVGGLGDAFLVALRLGSPFIAYALVVNLMVGLLNKLTPQIPIYFVSLPFVIGGGLLLFYFAVPVFFSIFGQSFSDFVVAQ